ncbi:PLP-dependent aminotransferase family protein [Vibrio nigripulchritudo]|uniref:aminotransferase-like domain-containing protein n=1 Tax=Vibrio nigripulchritudo TaxID=28173 RepID=UPI0003B1E50C|nr:PLP-dependent aminotransferase family protein [Vibrio nigripulchritudo]CCN72077.1 putative Bacterial regulatory protein GntR [Vibrio nigripulchritudo SFn118]
MTIETIEVDKSLSAPLYQQVADAIGREVELGNLVANDKLPTHRALADKLDVTVGTVTRAYAEAERRGLVEARVGAGTYIRDHSKVGWVFEESVEETDECNFGYNIPPIMDRSKIVSDALSALSQSNTALNSLMLYQKPKGLDSHREIISRWLNTHGVNASASNILFSSGAQHAIQMVLSAFTRAGDTILCEKFTYPGLLSLARQNQLTLKGVEMDEEGITPAGLESAYKQNQSVRFIYLTPTLQNPTTATMGLERRKAILELCKKYQITVIEDDVNGMLPDSPPSPMVNLMPQQVIHIGAFSKCLAPGLRVGYLLIPDELYPSLCITLQNHSWMISPLLTALTCQMIQNNQVEEVIGAIRKEMDDRLELTKQYLGDFDIRFQPHCFHLWLTLPEHWRLSDFIAKAAEKNVVVKSGELFVPPGGAVPPAIRLSLSSPITRQQLEKGLKILTELLNSNPISDFAL